MMILVVYLLVVMMVGNCIATDVADVNFLRLVIFHFPETRQISLLMSDTRKNLKFYIKPCHGSVCGIAF